MTLAERLAAALVWPIRDCGSFRRSEKPAFQTSPSEAPELSDNGKKKTTGQIRQTALHSSHVSPSIGEIVSQESVVELREPPELVPALRSRGVPPYDPLFPLSVNAIPDGLAATRLKIDHYQCSICGFVSRKYMKVVQRGASARRLGDLTTVCRPCWQVMNLEAAASLRSAVLIWLPEIAQLDLSRTMPAVHAARADKHGEAAATLANRVLDALKARTARADEATGLAGIGAFVDRLAELHSDDPEARNLRSLFGDGLRVLSSDRWIVRDGDLEFNEFPLMQAFWCSRQGPFFEMPGGFSVIAHDWLRRLGAEKPTRASD